MHKLNKAQEQLRQNIFRKQMNLNSQIIDYRNGRYQGSISNKQLKQGVGVFLDDNLTFIISEWKQDSPNQKTLIITRSGQYVYGNWDKKQQNFLGTTVIYTNNYLTLVNFQKNNIKAQMIVVCVGKKSILVLDKLQLIDNTINQQNIQIIEFTKVQEELNFSYITEKYGKKYFLPIQQHQYSIESFMKSFIPTRHYKELSKNILTKQSKQKLKQEQLNNYEQIFCFHQKEKDKKFKNQFYFGYASGIGINFRLYQNNFKLLTVGIHSQYTIKQIGYKVHQKRCVEQGDFLGKTTFTYVLQIQRPVDKLLSIYQKLHKKSLNFCNKYYQIKLNYFKIVDNYLYSKAGYIISSCQKQMKKKLQVMGQNKIQEKIKLLQNQQTAFKSKKRLNQKTFDLKPQRIAKNESETIKQIKQKKQQLKSKIQKVKYQIEYKSPQKQTNVFRKTSFMSPPISAKLDLSKSKIKVNASKDTKSRSRLANTSLKKEKQNRFQNLTNKIHKKQSKSPLYSKNQRGQKVFNELNIQKLIQKRQLDKNKYNGRQKKYSDEQLDAMIKDYKFRKERYNHINNKNVQTQQDKYEKQKKIGDLIRAELVQMTPEQYRDYQKLKQLETQQLQKFIMKQNQIIQEKINLQDLQQFQARQRKRLCGCKIHPHLQRQIYVYPFQQNLAQKRMRILSQFKNMNKTQQNGIQQLHKSYGRTLNEFRSRNVSRTHYNHALQTTFSHNIVGLSSNLRLQNSCYGLNSIQSQLERSRHIQNQLLKQQQDNLMTEILNKHIIEDNILRSGTNRYKYYFQ